MNRALRPRFVLPALAALAVALLASSAFSANQYATTPASAGAINPKAIPLGDGYVATTPKVGYIDSCTTSFGGQGGAQAVGPWINTTAKTWDNTTKIAVNGAVSWPTASYTNKVVGTKRVITFNDLPINHTTGTFPVGSSDPAANYDRNPNSIAAHSTSWTVPGVPAARATPACLPMGAIGVLTDGVYLFNGLDGEGRDAAAHEVLDACAGHPDVSSSYHHHDIPPCLLAKAANGTSTLVGYALDGYGIYVTKDAAGNLPTNSALDACHGTTSTVTWNGKQTRIFHYVATLEYPYDLGCYHGTAITAKAGQGGGAGGGPSTP